jgi:hypothetical protein
LKPSKKITHTVPEKYTGRALIVIIIIIIIILLGKILPLQEVLLLRIVILFLYVPYKVDGFLCSSEHPPPRHISQERGTSVF